MQDQIDELTLLLLYLTSFPDEDFDVERSWKGYPFESLDELRENRYITGSNRSKSVYLTNEGIAKAKELMEKYHIDEEI